MAFDGLDADTVFNTPCIGYNFADLVSLPCHAVHSVGEVDLITRFSRNTVLGSPIVSAPLDTVSEGRMAITCALLGGISVIHCNGSADQQAKEVSVVKHYEHGFIMDPNVLPPDKTVEDVDRLRQLTGCSTVLVTDSGSMGSKLMGIVTSRDIDLVEDRKTRITDIMTPKDELKFGMEPISMSQAQEKLRASRKGKLPIINEGGELVALVSRGDLKKSRAHPLAAQDANKQLLVAAAVKPGDGDRVTKLVEAGADCIVLDAAQGDSLAQLDFLKRVKHKYPNLDVVCGNVVAPRQAKPLLDAGADGLRVGMGCSSLFAAREACAIGRPQGSAVYHVARFASEQHGVPVCADGGILSSGSMSMALTLGASTVMCGSLLAGTAESPGEAFYRDGLRLKMYRGSGALDLMPAEGASLPGAALGKPAVVPQASVLRSAAPGCALVEKGSAGELLGCMLDGVKRDLRRLGVGSVEQLHEDLYKGNTRFHVRTSGARGPAAFR